MQKIKIYTLCFPCFTTGGIELIHQVTHQLNKHPQIQACVYYFNVFDPSISPQPKIYSERYDTPYIIGDYLPSQDSILIFPQTLAYLTNAPAFKNYKKIIYWESVDNYYHLTPEYLIHIFPKDTLHLVQSVYAEDFVLNRLKKDPNNVLFLTDYLSDQFFQETSQNPRIPAAAWNPKKEYNKEFIQKIQEYDPTLLIYPIEGLTTKEIVEKFRSSMLYLDFGNHPGKDRMPREAAMCGCCVITGKRGAAGIEQGDVLIPEEYKFEDKQENIPKIVEKIHYIFQNYNTCNEDFNEYRNMIRKEKDQFKEQIDNLVERIKKW